MKQLTPAKKRKLLSSLKRYRRKYLQGKYNELDESATRLMINDFLSNVLGFASLDEIKTEYMIRGTYADYVVQVKGKGCFIVEVKAMPLDLSEKHLRQAVNYAANGGIEWVLLTNGKRFNFYKIIFHKPIQSKSVFSFDLSDEHHFKKAVEYLQYMTKKLIVNRGLDHLWYRVSALDPQNVSRLLFSKSIVRNLRRQLKKMYRSNFNENDINAALTRVAEEKIENVHQCRERKSRKRHKNIRKPVPPSVSMPVLNGGQVINKSLQ